MSNQKENQRKKKTSKPNPSPVSLPKRDKEITKEFIAPQIKANTGDEPKGSNQKDPRGDVPPPKKWKCADIISLWGVILNFCTLLTTLIYIVITQNNLNVTINTLKENQRQFIASNNTFLEVKITEIQYRNDSIHITSIIKNLSKNPAKIVSEQGGIQASNEGNEKQFSENLKKAFKQNPANVDRYITPSIDFESPPAGKPLPIILYNEAATAPGYYIYWGGILKYIDLVNNKERVYSFLIRLKPDPIYGYKYEFIENENYDADARK